MSNLAILEFPALGIAGDNYLSWTTNIKRHLKSLGVIETLHEGNKCSVQNKLIVDVFFHKHIDNMLQFEYSNCQDPCKLCNDLKNRFDHQRDVLLPTARDEWNNIRFQDFQKVNDYTSALYIVCAKLEYCGQHVTVEDMLEKTFSTFHASNINLKQQYRLQKFKTYPELNTFLLVAENNNELLMKNHQVCLTGSLALREANVVYNNDAKNSRSKRERGRGRGRGRGRDHFDKNISNGGNHSFKSNNNYNRGNYHGRSHGRSRGRGRVKGTNNHHTSQNNSFKFKNETCTSQHYENSCYRRGSSNHWSKAYRTPSHLCELYQPFLKGKEKEVNLMDKFDNATTELNNLDFISELE